MDVTVSVIVPVYNTGKYLKRCVESIRRQTYKNLEILLVDDGSSDESGRICDQYAGEDSRIRTMHKENGGLVSAWKAGVKESRGEYLCFVDSDDWIENEMIAEMVSFLTGAVKEIIACDYMLEKGKTGSGVYQSLAPGVYEKAKMEKEVLPVLLGNEVRPVAFSRCMKLISRELILDNQKYSPDRLKMAEDVSIILPALLDCERLVIMDHKPFYHYFAHGSSMVHRYDAGLYQDICLLKESVDKALADKLQGETLSFMRERALMEFVFLLMLTAKNEVRNKNLGKSLRAFRELYRENEENRKILEKVRVTVSGKANKLVYGAMKKPDFLHVGLLKSVIWLYDRLSRS